MGDFRPRETFHNGSDRHLVSNGDQRRVKGWPSGVVWHGKLRSLRG